MSADHVVSSADGDFDDYFTAFDHVIAVMDATDIAKIIGTGEADIFHVQDTPHTPADRLVLDGGSGPDTFFFYADPGVSNPIAVEVNDVGEALKDENLIRIVGSGSADEITITSGDITLNAGGNQTVTYTPPSADPLVFTDQLIIKVFGNGGDDHDHRGVNVRDGTRTRRGRCRGRHIHGRRRHGRQPRLVPQRQCQRRIRLRPAGHRGRQQ